jgi:hypothetical protein
VVKSGDSYAYPVLILTHSNATSSVMMGILKSESKLDEILDSQLNTGAAKDDKRGAPRDEVRPATPDKKG